MVTVINDEQLMLRVEEGDLDAFNELVRRHQHTAWGIAHRFLGDRAEVEDLAQEAFLRILAAAPRKSPARFFQRICIVLLPDSLSTIPGTNALFSSALFLKRLIPLLIQQRPSSRKMENSGGFPFLARLTK